MRYPRGLMAAVLVLAAADGKGSTSSDYDGATLYQ